jgi:hypothetical protein
MVLISLSPETGYIYTTEVRDDENMAIVMRDEFFAEQLRKKYEKRYRS